jgi:hypothetical protein
MTTVWHVKTSWEADIERIRRPNSDCEADYVMLVGGLDGQICSTHDAHFRFGTRLRRFAPTLFGSTSA